MSTEESDSENLTLNIVQEPEIPWEPTTYRYFGLKNRSVLVTGEIGEVSSNIIKSQIQEIRQANRKEPIYIYINTPGGSITDALSIHDTLICIPNPIITIVSGACYSAGLLIACAGDHRLATPNSLYFYHQPNMQMIGVDSLPVMQSNKNFYKWCKKNTDKLMRKKIGMPKEKWKKVFGHSTSKYFDVDKAVEYGFCTHKLRKADKPICNIPEL